MMMRQVTGSFPWGCWLLVEGGRSEGVASQGRGLRVGAKIVITHLPRAGFLGDLNALVHRKHQQYQLSPPPERLCFVVERQCNLTPLPTYRMTLGCLLSLSEPQAHLWNGSRDATALLLSRGPDEVMSVKRAFVSHPALCRL